MSVFLWIKSIHVGSVCLSIAGFIARGVLMLRDSPLLKARFVRVAPHVVDTALLASAVAFLIDFRLIADVGATRALTVTFLIPPFGVLWGWLFLGEALPAGMLGGGILIVSGTVLVTRS